MKFTIGTVSNNTDFTEDLQLIKSSLLYADEIELIGMVEYAILNYLPTVLENAKDIYSLIGAIRPLLRAIDNQDTKKLEVQLEDILVQLEPYRSVLTKKKKRNRQELLAQMRMEQELKKIRLVLDEALLPVLNSDGANQLLSLAQDGLISIHDYKYRDFDQSTLAGGYVGTLLRTMQENTSYPLFDSVSNNAVSAFVDSNIIRLSAVNKEVIRHAGVATNILMTLPTLESASFDEILDFKKSMAGPLVNFRKAVYEFSAKIQTLPWDKDFQYECLKLYGMEVAPRIEELNVLSSETSTLKNFGKKVLADETVRKEMGYIAAGLATTVTTNTNLVGVLNWISLILNFGAKIGITGTAVTSGFRLADFFVKAKEEARKATDKMNENVMFYYYKASQDL